MRNKATTYTTRPPAGNYIKNNIKNATYNNTLFKNEAILASGTKKSSSINFFIGDFFVNAGFNRFGQHFACAVGAASFVFIEVGEIQSQIRLENFCDRTDS